MDFFSFNYKPKDFKKGDQDKTLPEILEMKPSKVGEDFFSKYASEIVEVGLKEETLEAIRLLSDLRDKVKIYDKCYNKAKRASPTMAPMPMPQAMQMPMQAPMPATMYVEQDQRPLIAQAGGRRRMKKRTMKKSKKAKKSMKKVKKSKKTRRSRKH